MFKLEENLWPFCQVRTCILASVKFLSEGDGNKRELQRQLYLPQVKQAEGDGGKRASLATLLWQQYRHTVQPITSHA